MELDVVELVKVHYSVFYWVDFMAEGSIPPTRNVHSAFGVRPGPDWSSRTNLLVKVIDCVKFGEACRGAHTNASIEPCRIAYTHLNDV